MIQAYISLTGNALAGAASIAMNMRQEKEYGGFWWVTAGGEGGALTGVRGGEGGRATGGGVVDSVCGGKQMWMINTYTSKEMSRRK